MFIRNLNTTNFLLDEKFYFYPLIPFITEGEETQWKLEYVKIAAEEVVFNNTNDNEELIIILSGSGGLTINDDSSLIKTGDLLHIPKNTIRSVSNVDQEELLHVIFITIC